MAGISSPNLPLASSSRPRHHRKRVSFSESRLSSDTTSSLPPYRSILPAVEPFEQPPDYPDSAEEADEESDLLPSHLISPPTSPKPRRKRFSRNDSYLRSGSIYVNQASQSDIFLDKILERSVAALEYSNTLLLQTSVSQDSAKPTRAPSPENTISDIPSGLAARSVTERLQDDTAVRERWMDNLKALSRDLDELCEGSSKRSSGIEIKRQRTLSNESEHSISQSLPSEGVQRPRKPNRRSSVDMARNASGSLQLADNTQRLYSHPPRAMTQYVHADAVFGDGTGSPSRQHTILLPSTNGLRSPARLADFVSPSSSAHSHLPSSSSCPGTAYARLARHAQRSPRSDSSSRSPSFSGSSSCTYRQRSSSRSSHRTSSPRLLPRLIPPPIEELSSQSESSSSDSPHPYRTVDSLRKILEDQPRSPDLKGKTPERNSPSRMPALQPRSPPVVPVSSTSTTTTSISRLFTKGAHSTTTRPRSPPKQSSLKRRPPQLDTGLDTPNSSGSLLPSPRPGSSLPSATSSGRSTPRTVAFGPLPEPHRREGERSAFREHREAKAKAKALQRSKTDGSHQGAGRKDRNGKFKEREGESSWWTTWLTGGSGLSMSAGRLEERVEDRMARSWGRPGVSAGFEDWPL